MSRLLLLKQATSFKRVVLFIPRFKTWITNLSNVPHLISCEKARAHWNLMHDVNKSVQLVFLDVHVWRHLPQSVRSIVNERETSRSFGLHPASVAFPPGVCGHLQLHLFLLLLSVHLKHTSWMVRSDKHKRTVNYIDLKMIWQTLGRIKDRQTADQTDGLADQIWEGIHEAHQSRILYISYSYRK